MKAHDVRHLCMCKVCGDLADDRVAIDTKVGALHGACAFNVMGIDGLLALPDAEIRKLTISDVCGANNMIKLCDEMERRAMSAANQTTKPDTQ